MRLSRAISKVIQMRPWIGVVLCVCALMCVFVFILRDMSRRTNLDWMLRKPQMHSHLPGAEAWMHKNVCSRLCLPWQPSHFRQREVHQAEPMQQRLVTNNAMQHSSLSNVIARSIRKQCIWSYIHLTAVEMLWLAINLI
jgi:hypothetical protein